MTLGNLIKNNFQHAFDVLFDTLSIEEKLIYDQMNCM